MVRFASLATVLAASVSLGCEDPPRVAPAPDASILPPPPPVPREGCARTGNLGGVESDPTCIVKNASADAMEAVTKSLSITLAVPAPEVVTGTSVLLELTIKNVSPREVTVLFEAMPLPPGARPDWSRVLGIPEPSANAVETPRLFFPLTTTDASGRDVDAVPTTAGSTPQPPPPTIFAVHLRPGGKLVQALSWWALRIPAPAPIVKDDAGHRYVPKTTATNLPVGDYTVTVELPLFGLTREERKHTAHVHVRRLPLLDGG